MLSNKEQELIKKDKLYAIPLWDCGYLDDEQFNEVYPPIPNETAWDTIYRMQGELMHSKETKLWDYYKEIESIQKEEK